MEKNVCVNCLKIVNDGAICNCRNTDQENDDLLIASFVEVTVKDLEEMQPQLNIPSSSDQSMEALLDEAQNTKIGSRKEYLAKEKKNSKKIEVENPKPSVDHHSSSEQKSTENLPETVEKSNKNILTSSEAHEENRNPANVGKSTNNEATDPPVMYFGPTANQGKSTGTTKKTNNKSKSSNNKASCKSPPKPVSKKDDSSPGGEKKSELKKPNNSTSSNEGSKNSTKKEKKCANTKTKVKKNNDFELDDEVFLNTPEESDIVEYRRSLYEKFLSIWCATNVKDYEDENAISVCFTLMALHLAKRLKISRETLESICKSSGTSFWNINEEYYEYGDYESLRIFKKRILFIISYKDRLRAERNAFCSAEVQKDQAQPQKKPIIEPEPEMFEMDLEENPPPCTTNPITTQPFIKGSSPRQEVSIVKPTLIGTSLAGGIFKGTQFCHDGISGLYDKKGNFYFNQGPKIPEEPYYETRKLSARHTDYTYPIQLSMKEVIDGVNYAVLLKEDGTPQKFFASAFYKVPKFPEGMTEKEKQIAMFNIVREGEHRVARLGTTVPSSPPTLHPMEYMTSAMRKVEPKANLSKNSRSPPPNPPPLDNSCYTLEAAMKDFAKNNSKNNISPKNISPAKSATKKEKSPLKFENFSAEVKLKKVEGAPQVQIKTDPNTRKPTCQVILPGIVFTAKFSLPPSDSNLVKSPSPSKNKAAANSPSRCNETEVLRNIENTPSPNGKKNERSPRNERNESGSSAKSPKNARD